ncbi:MAG: hypothetical protein ACPGQL_09840 [Thermoplasmatota archaeon]
MRLMLCSFVLLLTLGSALTAALPAAAAPAAPRLDLPDAPPFGFTSPILCVVIEADPSFCAGQCRYGVVITAVPPTRAYVCFTAFHFVCDEVIPLFDRPFPPAADVMIDCSEPQINVDTAGSPIDPKQVIRCAIALTSFSSCHLDLVIQDAHGRQYGAIMEERAQWAFCVIVVCSTAITTCWYIEAHWGEGGREGLLCIPHPSAPIDHLLLK